MIILSSLLFIIFGILAIGKGSDWLTDALVPLAKKLGISGISVGLLLVSAAVSLPEILVAVYTALQGAPLISLGVVLGSIICNIGLMIGLSALHRPLHVPTHVILRDGIFSMIVPILVFAISGDEKITRMEGLALALLFIPYVINIFLLEKERHPEQKARDIEKIEMELQSIGFNKPNIKNPWLSFFCGIGALLAGSALFGGQLIVLAKNFGFNELLIGVTVGAIGPSLPNIAAALKATKRGMTDVAVSETLGSNIFTLLVTLGVSAMVVPIAIAHQWLAFDLPAMIFMSVLLFLFSASKNTISRVEGGILLGVYLLLLTIQMMIL